MSGLWPDDRASGVRDHATVRGLYRSPGAASLIWSWCAERLDAWPVPHETELLVTGLGDTHLTWTGAGREALCVYLPGTNFNASTSTTVLAALGARYRVVCADLPGQPSLSAADRPVDEVAGYTEWLADLLAHVRSRHPELALVVVGHSRGAAAALLADPAYVDALVLVSPAGLAKVQLGATMLWRSLAWLLRPTPARSRRLVDLMAGPDGGAHESLVDWLTMVATHTRSTGAPDPLPPALLDAWRERPVRVLVGEHDVFFPPARLRGPARRLGAVVEVDPTAGHLLTDQRPDRVVDAVSRALG
jgi:pimeloyl-ACP methyl ester carboxylesterase